MIVKVQRSLCTSEQHQQVFIYSEDRSIEHQFDMTPEIDNLFDDEEYKIYCEAVVTGGQLGIGKVIEDQDW